MIFCSLALLSFVLVLVPDVKNRVSAWMRESMAVCSILSGAQIGVNVASGWFNFTDQADLVRFSVNELSAAPGINRRWSWIDVKLQSSNLDKALKKFTRQSVLPNGDKTYWSTCHSISTHDWSYLYDVTQSGKNIFTWKTTGKWVQKQVSMQTLFPFLLTSHSLYQHLALMNAVHHCLSTVSAG